MVGEDELQSKGDVTLRGFQDTLGQACLDSYIKGEDCSVAVNRHGQEELPQSISGELESLLSSGVTYNCLHMLV